MSVDEYCGSDLRIFEPMGEDAFVAWLAEHKNPKWSADDPARQKSNDVCAIPRQRSITATSETGDTGDWTSSFRIQPHKMGFIRRPTGKCPILELNLPGRYVVRVRGRGRGGRGAQESSILGTLLVFEFGRDRRTSRKGRWNQFSVY